MKKLKYLKLFEAFESSKLTKTLGFINSDSREIFLSNLKKLTKLKDFPLSQLSDDYFQYLPFQKALELNMTLEDEPCDETSDNLFGQYGIEGEVCKGGRIKRKWGANVRTVVCDTCKGTGVKPKVYKDIKWLKFWFSKDGEFIATTATDGKIRAQKGSFQSVPSYKGVYETSQNISDYEVVQTINRNNFDSLKNFSFVEINLQGTKLIGRIFKASGNVYVIQNFKDGATADEEEVWRKYGKYSWQISGGDYSSAPKLLILKKDVQEKEDEKVDPYTWNAPAPIGNYGVNIGNSNDMRGLLKDAHFAIVMDYLKFSKSSFKTKSTISGEREKSREGALKLIKPEEIRKTNLGKYFDQISANIEVSDDLKDFSKITRRVFGFSKMGYYILGGNNFSDFSNAISEVFSLIESKDDESKVDYLERIKYRIKNIMQDNINFSKEIDESFANLNLEIKKLDEEGGKRAAELLQNIQELNTKIYDKFSNYKVETPEDLEILYSKFTTLHSTLRNSTRVSDRYIYNLYDNIGSTRYFKSSFYNIIDLSDWQYKKMIETFDKFKKFIDRL